MVRKFTAEEDAFIRNNYMTIPTKRISKILGRSEGTARQRMAILGLKIPASVVEKFRRESQYKAGRVPENKGKRQKDFMSGEAINKTVATRFKKGARVHNEKYDGAVVTRYSHRKRNYPPYKWIRISKAKWKKLHVHLWEEANGAIPPGKIVVFKDRNTLNCELSNLDLLSREENMMRNTIQRYPPELKSTIRTLGKLKRTIENGTQQN